jgi:hypothetical protein
MATPEELHRQAEAVARVRVARIERDRITGHANRRLKRAVMDAIATGASVQDIAVAAELSRQRIYQMIHGR